MTINSQALTIALARQLAIADRRPQQAAIVQTAARQAEQESPKVAGDIRELADEVLAIKGWGEEKQK